MPETIKIQGEEWSSEQWDNLVQKDPTLKFLTSANWQDPSKVSETYIPLDDIDRVFGGAYTTEAIPTEGGWRQIQQRCWKAYREFPPLRSAIEEQADYVAGEGFKVYSDVFDIDRQLYNIYNSRKNLLYRTIPSWLIRMQAMGELFNLIAFDGDGNAIIRVIEPENVFGGTDDYGVITHPDDVTMPLFYYVKTSFGDEIIPDINILYEPELEDIVKDKLNYDKLQPSRSRSRKFKKFGGYRRFIIHWKNLTGEQKYIRDISSIMSILEWKNLYCMALKWQLDYKKAQASYAVEVRFSDTPAGRSAWQVWLNATQEEKDKTGLTKPLAPGLRVFTRPGMELHMHSPQLAKLSGENVDLLRLVGAGARTPQDLMEGQVSGMTYASLRLSRPPLVVHTRNLAYKLKQHLNEIHRACFYVKAEMGLMKSTYKANFDVDKTYRAEPIELVKFAFPKVQLDDRPAETANAWLGSKHGGIASLEISNERIAKEFGVEDYTLERRKKAIEDKKLGRIERFVPDTGGVQ